MHKYEQIPSEMNKVQFSIIVWLTMILIVSERILALTTYFSLIFFNEYIDFGFLSKFKTIQEDRTSRSVVTAQYKIYVHFV